MRFGQGRLGPLVAWLSLLALSVALVAISVAYDTTPGAAGFGSFVYGLAVFTTVAGTVGLFLRMRRPGHVVGGLLALGPLLLVGGFLGYGFGALRRLQIGPADPVGGLAGALASAMVVPGILVTFAAVAITFPDGRLPGPRWRRPVLAVAVAQAFSSIVSGLSTEVGAPTLPRNPAGLPLPDTLVAAASAAGTLALLLGMALAFAAVTVRFRRSVGIERQQMKWFVAAVGVNTVLLPLSFLSDAGPAEAIDLVSLGAANLIPIAIGVAVLRYRLYEIDRIVSRTIGWALMSGVIVATFVVPVLALQALLAGVTQGDTLAVAASTLVAASLFQPVRRRVQAAVDRRFDRARIDAQRTIADFSDDLRGSVALAAVTGALEGATEILRPAHVRLWLRSDPTAESAR